MSNNANEPAYPQSIHEYDSYGNVRETNVSGGLTKREYFAARAPKVADWFEPVMPMPKPKPKPDFTKGRPCWITDEPDNVEELRAWDREYQKQRTIQWPGCYADLLIAELQKNETK